MIYLDEAATTKPKDEVVAEMIKYLSDYWQNPSSLYSSATKVKHDIESVRMKIADFISCKPTEIYFTSGASESNNWVIQGFINQCRAEGKTPHIITSAIEHKSILNCVDTMVGLGVNVHYCSIDELGFIDINRLENLLQYTKDAPTLVSIQYANNEIGTIQNIKTISKLVHKYGKLFHTDATQVFGHEKISTKDIDFMSASGHKINAPKGIGFLYIKSGVKIMPLIYGSQERYMRGGTENVACVIGLGKAVDLCKDRINNDLLHEKISLERKNSYLMEQLVGKFNCTVNGSCLYRLNNNVNVTFPQNISSESLIYMLDTAGIYISSGSACNSNETKASYVLKAIGLSDDEAARTVRFTLSEDISYQQLDRVIYEIEKCLKVLTTLRE